MNFDEAVEKYSRALQLANDEGNGEGEETDELKAQKRTLAVSCGLNAAMCCMKTAPPDSTDGMLYAFNDPLRKLSHGNDGIIFTPVADAYVPGTCQAPGWATPGTGRQFERPDLRALGLLHPASPSSSLPHPAPACLIRLQPASSSSSLPQPASSGFNQLRPASPS